MGIFSYLLIIVIMIRDHISYFYCNILKNFIKNKYKEQLIKNLNIVYTIKILNTILLY